MTETRVKLSDRKDRTRGTIQVYREGPRKFVVERSAADTKEQHAWFVYSG